MDASTGTTELQSKLMGRGFTRIVKDVIRSEMTLSFDFKSILRATSTKRLSLSHLRRIYSASVCIITTAYKTESLLSITAISMLSSPIAQIQMVPVFHWPHTSTKWHRRNSKAEIRLSCQLSRRSPDQPVSTKASWLKIQLNLGWTFISIGSLGRVIVPTVRA